MLCHCLSHFYLSLRRHFLYISSEACLGCLLLRDRLGICCSFCGRLRHKLLILRLCVLLFNFHLLNLLVEIRHQHVHHRHHSRAFLALICISTVGLRGRWRCILQGRNTSACDAAW